MTIDKLDMLLYDFKYATPTYEQFCHRLDDDMEDAWMDSDDESYDPNSVSYEDANGVEENNP